MVILHTFINCFKIIILIVFFLLFLYMEELGHKSVVVDYRKDHYPLCIVWSPIPLLTFV